jgi:hypothetical protein
MPALAGPTEFSLGLLADFRPASHDKKNAMEQEGKKRPKGPEMMENAGVRIAGTPVKRAVIRF